MKKTVLLVDLVNTLYVKDKGIDTKMLEILEKYSIDKLIVTNASLDKLEEMEKIVGGWPFEVFTLEGNPRKEKLEYFENLISKYEVEAGEMMLVEHNTEVVKVAKSFGIKTFWFEKNRRDYVGLDDFLNQIL
jgi:FMN phosphatase YigB (HAD superfamily)